MNGRENCWRRRFRVSGSFERAIAVLRCRTVPLALVCWVNMSPPVDGTVPVINHDDREVMQYTRMEIRSIRPTTTTTNLIYIRTKNANGRWFIIQMLSHKSREASSFQIPPLLYTQTRRSAFGSPMPCLHGPRKRQRYAYNMYPLTHGRVLSYINVKIFLSSL